MKIPTTRHVSLSSFQSCFTPVFVRVLYLPSISHSIKGAFIFTLFTSIVMVIGILTVYYTSSKPPGMFFLCYIFDNGGIEKSNKIILFLTVILNLKLNLNS